MTNNRCQSKNPSQCVDPKCPAKRTYHAVLEKAFKDNGYEGFELAKKMLDEGRVLQKNGTWAKAKPVPAPPVNSPYSNYGSKPQRPVRKTNERLFHAEIGLPPGFKPPTGVRELEYSQHAKEAALDDRYGDITLPTNINLEKQEIIEVGVEPVGDGKSRVSKILYRGALDSHRDICVVVIPKPNGQKWFVKTVWINETNDSHKTLDRSKYVDPNRTPVR